MLTTSSLPVRSRIITLVVAMIVGLVPLTTAAAFAADPGVVATGLTGLVVGQPGDVTLTVTAPDGVAATTPLRIVGTFTGGAAPTVAAVTEDGLAPLELDSAGRFVVPAEDQPPLTLAGNPDLATGLDISIQVTLPDSSARDLSLVLAQSNERFAETVRFAGDDRMHTAALLSAANFAPGVDVAYVARADQFADALTAGPGAGLGGRPIVLTLTDEIPAVTRTELERLTPGRIVVLGGPIAVSDAVVADLADLTEGTVTRLAGDDRYATAAAVAKDAFESPVDTVVIASGENFPDALSGGAWAATINAPVLLVRRDEIPQATIDAIEALAPRRIVVLGGPVAVSDAVVGQLTALAKDGTSRVFGETRYGTSANISEGGFDPATTDTVFIATGENFPDALAGVPPAVIAGAPLLLVRRNTIPGRVESEIKRLRPARVVVLGGDVAIGPDVVAALTLITRTRPPSRDQFVALTTTTVPVSPLAEPAIVSPSTDEPAVVRPGDRIGISIVVPGDGHATISLIDSDGDAVALRNPTADVDVVAGDARLAINAPLDADTYDVKLSFTTDAGTTTAVAEDALQVGLTFPPPLISGLIEDTADQSQLLAVRPAGGLPEGTTLIIGLSSAEQASVDYPIGGDVTILEGTGTATLHVSRDGSALVRYVAGDGDQVPGGDATSHPLLTMRIDGIDVGSGNASHVGSFFRDDLGHGVSRTYTVGDPTDVARPTISTLDQGSGHTFQTIRFGLPTPLPAFGSVVIDLSDAEVTAAEYGDAFAYVQGGGHDPEAPGVQADAFLDVVAGESAVLTISAGPDGIPSVNGEGPFVDVFIGGIVVDDVETDPIVVVSRTDGNRPLVTSFHVGKLGLVNATASNLLADTSDQEFVVGVELAGAMEAGSGLEVTLPAPAFGTDLTAADVTVTSGSGTALLETYDYGFGTTTYLSYFSGGDGNGDRIEFTFDGVVTTGGDHTSRVDFYRYDTGGGATAIFDVGAGAPFIDPAVSPLSTGESDQYQFAAFALRDDLAPGETVTIDLSAAEIAGVDYAAATAYAYSGFGEQEIDFAVTADTSAVVTYTADADGVAAGSGVYIEIIGVATDAGEAAHDVVFTRTGGGSVTTTMLVARLPGVTAVSATDLAAGALGQTQTISFELVGDLQPFTDIEIDMSSGEYGAARYGGAEATVTAGPGVVEFYVYPGDYAAAVYRAGEVGGSDGDVITIQFEGVNTSAADETHVVNVYRYDSYRSSSARFNIGAGSPFLGRPYVDFIGASPDPQYQGLQWSMASPMTAGDKITVDFAAATGDVDYSSAEIIEVFGSGTATIDTSGGGAVITFTSTGGTRSVFLAMDGIVAPDFGGPYEVVFTDVASGRTSRTSFQVVDSCGHCEG